MRWRSLVATVLVAGAVLLAGYAVHQLVTWPDVARLATENPESTAFIERWKSRQRAAGRADRPAWTPVPYSRISAHLKVAVLVAEDIDFFSHDGFERRELKKAIADAWEKGEAPRRSPSSSRRTSGSRRHATPGAR